VPQVSLFEWNTEAIDEENIGGDASEANDENQDTISILSDISEEEDVPNSDQHTLNIFLQKAMNNMEGSIKRGSNGSAKATYAVRIGQKQARRTEYRHTQNKKRALEEGQQGGNQITNWFHPKGGPHPIVLQETDTYDSDHVITEIPGTFGGSPNSTSPAGSTPTPALHSPILPSTPPTQSLYTPKPALLSSGRFPPTLDEAKSALVHLKNILKPPRDSGAGYKDARLDLLLRGRLELMQMFLATYIRRVLDPADMLGGKWGTTSLEVAEMAKRGPWLAWRMRQWTHTFIADNQALPNNQYGRWNASLLEDEDFAQKIHLHLQSIGKYVRAMDIVTYLDTPEMKDSLTMKKQISLKTTQCWSTSWNTVGPKIRGVSL